MNFVDSCVVTVQAGRGGDGAVVFRREKFSPRGGPCGGDGGCGGSIIFKAVEGMSTLYKFRYIRKLAAENGESGNKNNRTGKSGKDLIINVPVGTQIFNAENNEIIFDMKQKNCEFIFIRGGKGGLGNSRFKTSINQTPREFTPGGEGISVKVRLELKLLADVGIIGFPNAGKSTFINQITNANSKVANYEFTTLIPILGKVSYREDKEFVIADIPGLIEGASQGKGLGGQFLKHVERCRILLHLISIENDDVVKAYYSIREELNNFSSKLNEKLEIVVLSKVDIAEKDEIDEKLIALKNELGVKVFILSSLERRGVDQILTEIIKNMDFEKEGEKEWSPI